MRCVIESYHRYFGLYGKADGGYMSALNNNIIKAVNAVPYRISGHQIKDVAHRELSITGILQKSSNVGVSRTCVSDAG